MCKYLRLFLCVVALHLSLVSSQNVGADDITVGADGSSALIFNGQDVMVNPSQSLNLDCGVDGKYRYCIWEQKGNNNPYQVEDVHMGVYPDLAKPEITRGNECGIVIKSVNPNHHGQWTCKVFIVADTLKGTKNVVVTVQPENPTLLIDEKPLVVTENEEVQVSCKVAAARPPVRFRWYAGTDDVTSSAQSNNNPIDEMGTYQSVSTLTYRFDHKYSDAKLRCSIEHYTLDEQMFSEVPLDIRFQPYAYSSREFYGIPMNTEYEIKFNLTAHPKPEATWLIDGEEIPVPAELGRFETKITPISMKHFYMVSLRINKFTSEDINRPYKLQVSNDVGVRNFDISLSTGPAPPDTMGTGSVAAIVIVIVLIVILLFIIGMMRYRQVYCFGQRDRVKNHMKSSGETLKEEHDTESAKESHVASKSAASSPFKNIKMKFRSKKDEKHPSLENIEEGEVQDSKTAPKDNKEGKHETPEVVYTDLQHTKISPQFRKNELRGIDDKTEYIEIVGTVPDNKDMEKKE